MISGEEELGGGVRIGLGGGCEGRRMMGSVVMACMGWEREED